jgi:predicted ATPase
MSHPFTLGGAYVSVGAVYTYCRDWQAGEKQNEKVLALAEEYALGDMHNYGIVHHALCLAYQEPTEAAIERAKRAIEALQAKGASLAMTWYLGMLGEVFGLAGRFAEGLAVIADALAEAERTGERYYEAELWRIKGDLLLKADASNSQASGAQAEAERCFHQAVEIARRQSARMLALRATVSLARLWAQQGKTAEAQPMLAEIYGWFTEGFDTVDLKEAKALLDGLQTRSV